MTLFLGADFLPLPLPRWKSPSEQYVFCETLSSESCGNKSSLSPLELKSNRVEHRGFGRIDTQRKREKCPENGIGWGRARPRIPFWQLFCGTRRVWVKAKKNIEPPLNKSSALPFHAPLVENYSTVKGDVGLYLSEPSCYVGERKPTGELDPAHQVAPTFGAVRGGVPGLVSRLVSQQTREQDLTWGALSETPHALWLLTFILVKPLVFNC